MKKILLLDPGVSSMNLGDKIISDSAKRQIEFLLNKSFVTEISTHMPMTYYYMRLLKNSDHLFVLGSNLLKSTSLGFKRQWDITLKNSLYVNNVKLIGAGWWQYGNNPNLYTKLLYKSVLDKNILHSVRDEYTKNVLNDMGIKNVVNTSCSTMWGLTPENMANINRTKSNEVIFTLTDYNKDYNKDRKLITTLINNYEVVNFWPQGIGDFQYINEFSDLVSDINIINPSLESFDAILSTKNIDYVGTRLHGGIRALQKGCRSMIIGIDNRAEEKKKSFNLPVISRENLDILENEFINSELYLDIQLPLENINKWKSQFI